MKSSFLLGRVRGIEIKVHASFFLILLLGAMQWGAPHGARGALFGALLMALLFACVVLHELGHSLVAGLFGIPVKEIILLPIGGISRMERNPEKPVHEFVISLVGPLVNVAVAAVLFVATDLTTGRVDFRQFLQGTAAPPSSQTALSWLFGANILLAVFNLIPAFPMDGGRVLRAALALFVGYGRATRIASGLGQLIAIALGLVGILSGNFLLALVALFIFMGAGQERHEETARVVLGTLRVGDAYNKYAITLAPGDSVRNVVDYLLTSYQPDFAVVLGGKLLGVVTRDDVLKTLASQAEDAYVAGIMKRDVLKVDASEPLDEVRKKMMENGVRIAAVYRGDGYLGLVSLEDIAEALLVVTFLKNQEARRRAVA